MIDSRNWFQVILLNFLIAAIFGVLLRIAFITEISWLDFRNFMHGHSHTAMLGWLCMALFIFFITYFLGINEVSRKYKRSFVLLQISVIGMAVSFPIQGYGAFSIFFSTIHVLVSYLFLIFFFKDVPMTPDHPYSTLLVRTSLIFMLLSTLGLFAMAPIMILDLRTSAFYYQTIQFFLHFQFNGWFIFGVLAIFFRILENSFAPLQLYWFKTFYWLLVISCIMTYALAVTWSNPSPALFIINSSGVILQLIALFFFLKIIIPYFTKIRMNFSKIIQFLFSIALFSFCIKIIVQTAVVLPFIAQIAYTIRNYVVGFIHLILLGMITFAIIGFAIHSGYLNPRGRYFRIGLSLLISGIILSELILFLQGTLLWAALGFIPFYYIIICSVSALMPIGIGLIWLSNRKRN